MMFCSWNIIWCIILYLLKVTTSEKAVIDIIDEDYRRPIWNVAHMVNSLYHVNYYLDQGANSLEFDISFDSDGTATHTFHGIPCDCFRSCGQYEDITHYIKYIRNLTSPGHPMHRPALVLLFMDMKISGLASEARVRAGEDIATKLLNHYWLRGSSTANAHILISTPSVTNMDFIQSFRRKLLSENFRSYDNKIGYDFSGNEDLDTIRAAFRTEKIEDRIWQGDGITNCLPRGTTRLREALRRRDEHNYSYINKVYWWTVDKMSTMRTTLSMGVDGMITNYPDRLISILNEEEFSSKFRLATILDNPWITHKSRLASIINFPAKPRSGNITKDLEDEEEDELLYNCSE